MSEIKKLAGDSATSSEFWLLPPVLALIAEGGLTDVQSVAVSVAYGAFVWGRVAVKRDAAKALGVTRVAPLLLAGVLLVALPSCGSLMRWFDEPVVGKAVVTVVDADGNERTIDTSAVPEGAESFELPGVGVVTLVPDAGPVTTKGDAVAVTSGQVVTGVTGVTALGLIVTKILLPLIGSRRRKDDEASA